MKMMDVPLVFRRSRFSSSSLPRRVGRKEGDEAEGGVGRPPRPVLRRPQGIARKESRRGSYKWWDDLDLGSRVHDMRRTKT